MNSGGKRNDNYTLTGQIE